MDVDIYLMIFGCILVLYTLQINNQIIGNASGLVLLHLKSQKHERQYLTKQSVSSKYRVESES